MGVFVTLRCTYYLDTRCTSVYIPDVGDSRRSGELLGEAAALPLVNAQFLMPPSIQS
jgi:hypothetical protein